jgi:hypothetical protein
MDLASEVRVEEEQPQIRRIPTAGQTRLLGIGVTEMGPTDGTTRGPFTSLPEWETIFGGLTALSLDAHSAVTGFFENGGQQLYWSRVVHNTVQGDPTTKTSAIGSVTLATAPTAPSAGTVLSAVQPYNLEPGEDLDIVIDAGAPLTATVTATAATRSSTVAATFALVNNQTLVFTDLSGSGVRTKTFLTAEFVSIGAATLAEVVASLNAFFASQGMAAVAEINAGAVRIRTTQRGTGAAINISATSTAVALGFTTGLINGTGNVVNVDVVTAAEIASMVATAIGAAGTAVVEAGAVRITSATTGGSSSVQVAASSTADVQTGFDNAVHSGSTGVAVNTLRIDAKWDGTYAAGIRVIVSAATSGVASEFNLAVEKSGRVLETWPNLTMTDGATNYVETIVNADTGSKYVQAVDLDAATPSQRPASGTSAFLAGGNDGLVSLADTDYIGGSTVNGVSGLRALDATDGDLLIVPGRATQAVLLAMVAYCEIQRSGLLYPILDCPAGQTAEAVSAFLTASGMEQLSEFGAFYWPRIKVLNPSKTLFGSAELIVVPTSGHVAGAYARTDASKIGGQFEQPAGTETILRGAIEVEMADVLRKEKRDLVFPKNINPISQENGSLPFIDGARNLKTTGNWPSVGQRRGVIFVEQRLIPGLAFLRHKNLKPRNYKAGERTISVFLLDLTRAECFASNEPSKAFFVDLGPGLNGPLVKKAKRMQARIGLATSEPGEFIVLLVGPDNRALDAELAALTV